MNLEQTIVRLNKYLRRNNLLLQPLAVLIISIDDGWLRGTQYMSADCKNLGHSNL